MLIDCAALIRAGLHSAPRCCAACHRHECPGQMDILWPGQPDVTLSACHRALLALEFSAMELALIARARWPEPSAGAMR